MPAGDGLPLVWKRDPPLGDAPALHAFLVGVSKRRHAARGTTDRLVAPLA